MRKLISPLHRETLTAFVIIVMMVALALVSLETHPRSVGEDSGHRPSATGQSSQPDVPVTSSTPAVAPADPIVLGELRTVRQLTIVPLTSDASGVTAQAALSTAIDNVPFDATVTGASLEEVTFPVDPSSPATVWLITMTPHNVTQHGPAPAPSGALSQGPAPSVANYAAAFVDAQSGDFIQSTAGYDPAIAP